MANPVKAEGLVLAFDDGTNIYPFACAQNSSIVINTEFLELAPKTNGIFKSFLPARKNYTISGSGLVKMQENYMQDFDFFSNFITGTETKYTGYLDLIDASNNYKVYEFNCYISSLTLESTPGQFATYSYALQGTDEMTEISISDTYTVSSGKITGRDTATYKLLAIGYGGAWYYNYSVSNPSPGVFEITMGVSLNSTSVKAIYKAI